MRKKNNLNVVITRGLPASGKSTFAREWVQKDPENRVQIEKDEIRKDKRLFKDGVYVHKRGDEGIVLKERDRLIHQALGTGKSVISSDTNLVQKHITQISNIAKKYDAEVEVKKFLDVPLADLIDRDQKRENPVGEQVIRRMFHEQVKTMPTFYNWVEGREVCVISDIDGTLTRGPKNRSPYEWHKVGNDDLNEAVSAILDSIRLVQGSRPSSPVKTFLFSGRDAVCRPETEEWLDKHCIDYDELYMRPEGDSRNDAIIKRELFDRHIRGKYNVLFVLDDRARVCDMWRDVLGLNVLQLGDPNWKF